MEIWNYHPETLELLGKNTADESPLEPGVWLIPAHATDKKPPKNKKGYALVFVDDQWAYEEDHRGEVWWDSNGNNIIIKDLGKIVEGLSSVEPVIEMPVLTPAEKLEAAGLTVDELKSLLGLK